MNINEYIEKHSTTDVKDGIITVTVCVPPRKIVNFESQESDETQHIVLRTEHVLQYLQNKGVRVDGTVQGSSTNNNHPKVLTGTWTFSEQPRTSAKRRRTTQTKKTNKKEV